MSASELVLAVRNPYAYYLSMYAYAQRPPEVSLCAEADPAVPRCRAMVRARVAARRVCQVCENAAL